MSASVLILTKDEEVNLPRCLASLGWCDDVVVLDSGSADRTRDIAAAAGARVVERPFDDYASQRNFGLNQVEYRHPWVLMVDADEAVTPELAEEIGAALCGPAEGVTLYRMRRKDHFMGRWLRRSSGYPTWFGRLARVGRVRVERAINEEYHTDGRVGLLQGHLLHYPFNKGIHAWLEKHNRYSTMEGELLASARSRLPRLALFLSEDATERRRAAKALLYRIPGRPLVTFVALYVLRGGFLDGRAGLTFCALRAFYEFLIDCKVREARLRSRGLPL